MHYSTAIYRYVQFFLSKIFLLKSMEQPPHTQKNITFQYLIRNSFTRSVVVVNNSQWKECLMYCARGNKYWYGAHIPCRIYFIFIHYILKMCAEILSRWHFVLCILVFFLYKIYDLCECGSIHLKCVFFFYLLPFVCRSISGVAMWQQYGVFIVTRTRNLITSLCYLFPRQWRQQRTASDWVNLLKSVMEACPFNLLNLYYKSTVEEQQIYSSRVEWASQWSLHIKHTSTHENSIYLLHMLCYVVVYRTRISGTANVCVCVFAMYALYTPYGMR